MNNAGTGDFAGIEETTTEQWRRVFAVNLDGVFHGMQAGIAAMKDKGGAIVNVASIAANVAEPDEIARPILFLASDDASYMVGSELIVDGGFVAP